MEKLIRKRQHLLINYRHTQMGKNFEKVRGRKDLNGLEKMKEVVRLTQEPEWSSLSRQSLPLLKNPRLLVKAIEDNQRIVTPLWLELIEEGMADGSIRTVTDGIHDLFFRLEVMVHRSLGQSAQLIHDVLDGGLFVALLQEKPTPSALPCPGGSGYDLASWLSVKMLLTRRGPGGFLRRGRWGFPRQ